MTTPGKAKASGESPDTERDAEQDARVDRDTVELDASTLSRLRQFDADVSVADRDTVELSAAESLSLARHADRSSPFASGEAPAMPNDSAPDDSAPAEHAGALPADEEAQGDSAQAGEAVPSTELLLEPPKSIRSLADVEAEGDRSSMLTIPSPPTFEEES